MALLGELESRVMGVLWAVGHPATVRDVHTQLAIERDLAYTTVMTVLDRLAKKNVLARERQGRQWLYAPVQSREALYAREVLALLGEDPGVRQSILAEVLRRLPAAECQSLLRRFLSKAAS